MRVLTRQKLFSPKALPVPSVADMSPFWIRPDWLLQKVAGARDGCQGTSFCADSARICEYRLSCHAGWLGSDVRKRCDASLAGVQGSPIMKPNAAVFPPMPRTGPLLHARPRQTRSPFQQYRVSVFEVCSCQRAPAATPHQPPCAAPSTTADDACVHAPGVSCLRCRCLRGYGPWAVGPPDLHATPCALQPPPQLAAS